MIRKVRGRINRAALIPSTWHDFQQEVEEYSFFERDNGASRRERESRPKWENERVHNWLYYRSVSEQ